MNEVLELDLEEETEADYIDTEGEDDSAAVSEEYIPKWRRSPCPDSKEGHDPILKNDRYVCAHCGKLKWTGSELEAIADALLKEDSNAELCRVCVETDKKQGHSHNLPYGHETGHIEWQIQKDKEGNVLLDDEGNALYVAFPELECDQGHRWYKGEGPRRNINGLNPILFETHIYNRKRREIHVKDGIPDPAFTMDRWNKRPTQGIYNRVHPLGRKVNTPAQRAASGASYYR